MAGSLRKSVLTLTSKFLCSSPKTLTVPVGKTLLTPHIATRGLTLSRNLYSAGILNRSKHVNKHGILCGCCSVHTEGESKFETNTTSIENWNGKTDGTGVILTKKFNDELDAVGAVSDRDGYNYDGYTLREEFPRGSGPGGPGGDRDYGGGGGGGGFHGGGGGGGGFGGGRGGGGGGRGGQPSRRSEYRVLVSGLPPTGSWQDLKDHMREAGVVCYADVYNDGTGVCEYLREEDIKYACRTLDDSKFRSREGETSYIKVKEDSGGR